MRILFEGCEPNISNKEYHAVKEYISRSALLDFDKNPYTYWAKHLNPDIPQQELTSSMIFGSAFHTLILEPDKFNDEYAHLNPKVLLKDVGREIYNNFKKENEKLEKSGKILLSCDEWKTLFKMRDRLLCDISAVDLLEEGRIENSFFWKDDHSDLYVKARPDILHENMIVDLKTCFDASPRAFQRAMVDGGYHIQGAMVRDGVEKIEGNRINTVINICVETKYPYNIAIYIIDEFALDEGHMKYKQLLLDLKNAMEKNEFKSYGIQTIGLPKWA